MPMTFTFERSLSITGGTKGCDDVPELLSCKADEAGEEGTAEDVSRFEDADDEALDVLELARRDEWGLEDGRADESIPDEPSAKEGREGQLAADAASETSASEDSSVLELGDEYREWDDGAFAEACPPVESMRKALAEKALKNRTVSNIAPYFDKAKGRLLLRVSDFMSTPSFPKRRCRTVTRFSFSAVVIFKEKPAGDINAGADMYLEKEHKLYSASL